MLKQALFLLVSSALASPSPGPDRWSPAEEWEDAQLAIFYTAEIRGYVEPCG